MIVRDLSADAVGRMARVNLATVERRPDSLIEPFEFHGCDCGVASFIGRPPWELHTAGDELLQVLSGECRLTLRQSGREIVRDLRAGDVAVIPAGCWHNNDAPEGVTVLFMTPREGTRNSVEDPGF